jgi:IS5 family transposase
VIPAIEQLVGNTIERLHADAGYRGHNAAPECKFKIYTSRQKRRVTLAIKREMKRRAAVEPVIGHLKEDHRMDRNYLAHRHGDANNAVLAAVGYNFRRLIRWLRILLRLFPAVLFAPPNTLPASKEDSSGTTDYLLLYLSVKMQSWIIALFLNLTCKPRLVETPAAIGDI